MSDKFTNNVRARLYKQGYQGFTKDDYTTAAIAVECDDLENPTKEQLTQAVDYLKGKTTCQLSVVDELVEEKFLSQVESEQPDPELDNSQLAVASREINSITVTNEDKRQIVTAQSSALGFELTEQETLSIAYEVDDTFTDYSQFISSVTAAIKNYVDQKFDVTALCATNWYSSSSEKNSFGVAGLNIRGHLVTTVVLLPKYFSVKTS